MIISGIWRVYLFSLISEINSNPSIKKVLFNGGKAYRKALDYGCLNVEMPSTSSANTHLTQEELFSIWVKEIKEK